MAATSFFGGALFGAALATLLTHADTLLSSENWSSTQIPLSPLEALSQIRAKWTRPTLVAIAVLRHPLLLSLALALLMAARRAWRSVITRALWLQCPSLIKAALESHASLLGVLVTAAALGAVITLSSSSQVRSNLDSLLGLDWPHAHLLGGLVLQLSLPFAIHPSLAPQLFEVLSRGCLHGRSFLSAPIVRRALRVTFGTVLLMSVLWIIPLTFEAGVLWWQEEALLYLQQISGNLQPLDKMVLEGEEEKTSPVRGGNSAHWWSAWFMPAMSSARNEVHLASLRAIERSKAERAAATLRTLASFAMLRRVGKSIDLQLGHYYRRQDANGRIEERPAAAVRRRTVVNIGKVGRARSLLRAIGAPQWLKSLVRSLRWLAVTPPTYLFWYSLSLEMAGARGWRRLLLPVLLFALNECSQTIRVCSWASNLSGSWPGWRSSATHSGDQVAPEQLLVLLVAHERYAVHERLRLRSAHWLHRLELAAALHWMTLAAAVVASTSGQLVGKASNSSWLSWLFGWAAFVLGDGLFGPPPPRVGVLLGLPAACLVGITWLEQLPGDASEVKVLLREAARVNEPGDLKHLVSGNAWYRGLLDLLVVDPEALTDVIELDAAQRNLPWWLRPPLPDSTDLRSSRLNLAALASSEDNLHAASSAGTSLVAGTSVADAHASALSVLDNGRDALSGMGRTFGLSSTTRVRRVLSGSGNSPLGARKQSIEPLEATLRRVPSHRVLLLAIAKPVGGLASQFFNSLPNDLADCVSEAWTVVLAAVFGRGGERTEQHISEALRVCN